jgi:tRNA threonylcarbamoyladenosine biosynthesis protein TsaE
VPNGGPGELDQAGLVALGETLGRSLPPGAVVWLEGDLGAGKTTLVQAIARGLGVAELATSPSYALVHRYQGRRGPIYHVDCYRLRDPAEARDLDWATLTSGDAILIEWPAKAGPWAPPPTRRIRLDHLPDPDRRSVEVSP